MVAVIALAVTSGGCSHPPSNGGEAPERAGRPRLAIERHEPATALPGAANDTPVAPSPTAVGRTNAARAAAPPATSGLLVERVLAPLAPAVDVGDRVVTVVRVDPRAFRIVLRTAGSHGGARTAPRWADDLGLAGVANAGMFHPDLRSVGLLQSAGEVEQPRDNPRYSAFLAVDPVAPARNRPAVAIFQRGCPGFDLPRIRREYDTVLQSIAMLDCDGRPIPSPGRRVYSASAAGLDAAGRLVFVHVRTPYSMGAFREILASPAVGLRAALYLEGGPEASLVVRAGTERVAEMGSYETGFFESDDNHRFWDIPNVIGFEAR